MSKYIHKYDIDSKCVCLQEWVRARACVRACVCVCLCVSVCVCYVFSA